MAKLTKKRSLGLSEKFPQAKKPEEERPGIYSPGQVVFDEDSEPDSMHDKPSILEEVSLVDLEYYPPDNQFDMVKTDEALKELQIRTKEYVVFLRKAAKQLHSLEDTYFYPRDMATDESVDRLMNANIIEDDLRYIEARLTEAINEKNRGLLKNNHRFEEHMRQFRGQFHKINQAAEALETQYKYLRPEESRKFTVKNDNLCNRVLNKFIDFMNLIKSKVGFSNALKRDIVADIKIMRAQHNAPRNKME